MVLSTNKERKAMEWPAYISIQCSYLILEELDGKVVRVRGCCHVSVVQLAKDGRNMELICPDSESHQNEATAWTTESQPHWQSCKKLDAISVLQTTA